MYLHFSVYQYCCYLTDYDCKSRFHPIYKQVPYYIETRCKIQINKQIGNFIRVFTPVVTEKPLFLFVTKYHAEMEDKNLTLEQEAQIKEKATALKAEKKTRKVYPMVVFGDTDCGEKEFYVAYMGEPTFPQFSKFMAASKKDEVNAMRQLARDCFLDGDKELVDNESLFLFGLMSQLSEIITTRQSLLVN